MTVSIGKGKYASSRRNLTAWSEVLRKNEYEEPMTEKREEETR